MRVAVYAEIPWRRFAEVRGAENQAKDVPEEQKVGGRYRRLFRGTPGKPGHFEMVVLWSPKSNSKAFFPRHRHDFDQLRYTLSGNPYWAPDRSTPPGSLLYTAAGTYYGPYERFEGEEQLHIQFEGANGAPFVDYESQELAHAELVKKGTFEKGVYSWVDEQGRRHNMDGHQAATEYVTGRKEEFPEPRFTMPVEMNPSNFSWHDLEPGIKHKELASFTERGTRIAMLRLDGHASYQLATADRSLLVFVASGEGEADGQHVAERDGIFLEPGDAGVLSTEGHLELLLLGLPCLDGATH